MAIRTINYTVTESGITPATQQFGGVQGEHNATELVFALDAALLETIREKAGENRVVYRFDVHDGAGGVTPTDPLPLTDDAPVYLLENKISRIGGSIQVFLIITEIENEQTEMELYSFPALLRLKEKQDGTPNDGEDYESISTLAENAKKSATQAADCAQASEDSATAARESRIKTEETMLALESGVEVVFLGGNHAKEMKILAAVDSEMSEASTNPVQNKTLNKKLSAVDADLTTTEEKVEDLDTRLTTTEEKVEDLDTRLTTTEGQVADLVERDYIVKQGISGIWTYRKWASGIAECWGCVSHTASGSAEYFQQIIVSLPSIFKERGRAFISTTGNGGYNIPKAYDNTFGTTEVVLTYYQNTIREELCEFMVFVLGRWK